MVDAFAVGQRLHHRDALFDQAVEVLVGEGKVDLAGLDPADRSSGDVGYAFAGGADVLHVFDVALVAERAERSPIITSAKPMMALSGVRTSWLIRASMSALGGGRALGQPPRLRSSFSAFWPATGRETPRRNSDLGPGAAHRHRQRDQAAAAYAAQQIAAVFGRLAISAPLMLAR